MAQRLDSLAGKTLRLNDDGSIPPDNPFVGQPNARPEIWSYGHRNAQGIDWQPGTDAQFQTEHGPSGFDGPGGGDEVNIVERGRNYGWPVLHHTQTKEGAVAPLLEYTPAVAPASAIFYRGAAFPQFRGNFFFGNLKGECLIRVTLDGRRVVNQERLLQGRYGRIREVAEGIDGAIYFSTSNRDGRGAPAGNDDRILRLVPASNRGEPAVGMIGRTDRNRGQSRRSERMNGDPETTPTPPDYPVPEPEPPGPYPPDFPVPKPGDLPDYPVPEPEEPLPKPDEPSAQRRAA